VVVEMIKASWVVRGSVPVERQPLKKLEPGATALLRLIERWQNEAGRAGRPLSRIALAYETGRDGLWLARLLMARGIEAHVIHSASVAVSCERKRPKMDRLDAAMLVRVFLGWLRGERGHCGMVAIPTMEEEDGRRPSRERESLVNERSRIINRKRGARVIARGQWRTPLGSSSCKPPDHGSLPPCSRRSRTSGGSEGAPSSTLIARDGDGNMRLGRVDGFSQV
jgi:transposase